MSLRTFAFSALLLAAGLCPGSARAQGNVNALLAMPLGDFSSDADAVLGYGVGAEYNVRLGTSIGGWVSGLSFNYNASDITGLPPGTDVKGGNYFTLPALTGFRLTGGSDNDRVKFYFQGQTGVLYFMPTDLKVSDASGSSTTSTDAAVSFAFGGGFGFIVKNKIHAGMRILGTPDITLKSHVSGGGFSGDFKEHMTVSMIQFCLGMMF